MPGKWKEIVHDQTVTWLANWTENVNGQHKYVFLAAGSSLKGQSDMQKFEKARELMVDNGFFLMSCSNLTTSSETCRQDPRRLYRRSQKQNHGGPTESYNYVLH